MQEIIPNFDAELLRLREIGTAGFILAFNVTFRGPEHLHSEYPEAWRALYEEKNYFAADPVFIWILTHSGHKRWSEIPLPDPFRVKAAAGKFGLNYGAAVSMKIANKRSFITFARSDREVTDVEMASVATLFRTWAEIVTTNATLTAGELATLRCLRNGLSIPECAVALHLSESAVKLRITNCKKKLGARSTVQAVSRAVAQNLFDT